MITCYDINRHMSGSKCPTANSLGECAAITRRWAEGSASSYFTAHLYLWAAAENLSTKTVAKWFSDLGAKNITIEAVLHEPDNDVFDGRCHDGVRPWNVSYFISDAAGCECKMTKDAEGGVA